MRTGVKLSDRAPPAVDFRVAASCSESCYEDSGGRWGRRGSNWMWVELCSSSRGCVPTITPHNRAAVSAASEPLLFVGHSHQRQLSFAACDALVFGGVAEPGCNHYRNRLREGSNVHRPSACRAAFAANFPRPQGFRVTSHDDLVTEVVRVANLSSPAKPIIVVVLRSCGSHGQCALDDWWRRVVTVYIKSQFAIPPWALRVLDAPLKRVAFRTLLYGRGAWDLQYNDTQPHELVRQVTRDVSALASAASRTDGSVFALYLPHANHPLLADAKVNLAKPKETQNWLNTCRGRSRTIAYRTALREAFLGSTTRLLDVWSMTNSPLVPKSGLVDASGHHYSKSLLEFAAGKLLLARYSTPRGPSCSACMPMEGFSRRDVEGWQSVALCDRVAHWCHWDDGSVHRNASVCRLRYG